MFGSKKESTTTTTKKNGIVPTPSSNALNSLVHGTMVEGTIKSESDIRVDGVIKGALNCKSKVIIGPTGAVEGEIRCTNAVIEGSFEGRLVVNELLNVRETAKISGEVKTKQLIVQSGAVFDVTCTMGSSSSSSGSIKSTSQTVVKTSANKQQQTAEAK